MFHISTKLIWVALLFSTACGSADDNTKPPVNANSKMTPDGMAVFRQKCVTCHGSDGTLGLNGAKDLTKSTLTIEERINIITNGKNLMTPFGALLSREEIQAAAAYTASLKK